MRGQGGSGRLRRWVEEALGGEPGLDGLEAQRQVADTGRLEAVDVELVGALRLEHVDPAVGHDADAGAGLQRHDHAIVAEDHAAQLGSLVLEREVAVPGGADGDLADLALDPDAAEPRCRADGVADEPRQVADREDLGAGRPGPASRRERLIGKLPADVA